MSNLQFGKRRLAGAVGAVAAGFGATQATEAAVVFTSVDVDIPAEVGDYHVNLNGDATNEFDIQQFENVVKVADFFAGVGVALDGGSPTRTANLAPGTLIDSSLTYGVPSADPLTGIVGGNPSGNFQVSDGPGFIGVRFPIAGNTHYGFVGYEGTGAENSANGRVFALAYENTPNAAITAIPEPTSLALLAAGAGGAATYRRRRWRSDL